MSIYAICTAEERAVLVETAGRCFDTDNVEFIADGSCLLNSKAKIVISHAAVHMIREQWMAEPNDIYLFYSGEIVSAGDEDKLVDLLNEAISDENWKKAKAVNDLLIDINFLCRKRELSSLPNYLQIETTSYCNAKCIMCSHYFSENRDASNLGDDTLGYLEDAIQLSHTISLNGMGEPFISPRLSDQIDLYARYGNKIVTNTNLSILNDRLIEQINAHFEWLEVSCDGATKDTYEAVRQNLSFDVFLKNLYILKEKCPKVRKHIATVIMRQNVREMPLMVELASRVGVSVITFMTLNSNIVIHNQKDEMCHYPKVLEYYSVQAVKAGEKLGVPVVVPNMNSLDMNITFEEIEDELNYMDSIPLFKDQQEKKKMKKTADIVTTYLETHDEIQRDTRASSVRCQGICDWLLSKSYIDLKGNVAMCCRNQSFHTGNVNVSGSFRAVWNSPFYQKLRDIFYSGYVPESCLKCGLIESGNLEHLKVEITEDFYQDPEYKIRQKETLKTLLKGAE